MSVNTFESRDGQIHLGIPKGDSASVTIQAKPAQIPPFSDWTGWAWTFRVTHPDTNAVLFSISEVANAAGQITDASDSFLGLNLTLSFLPSAYATMDIGPNYNWGLRGAKGSLLETIVDDGIFFLVKGPFS